MLSLVKDDGQGDITYSYEYNGLGQLVGVVWPAGDQEISVSKNGYDYDPNGNMASKTEETWDDPSWVVNATWVYEWDVLDRLVSVTKKDSQQAVMELIVPVR